VYEPRQSFAVNTQQNSLLVKHAAHRELLSRRRRRSEDAASFFFSSFRRRMLETPTRNCDKCYTRPRRDTLAFRTEQQSMAYRRKLSERAAQVSKRKMSPEKTPWGPFELPTRKRESAIIWIDGCTNYACKADSCKCDLTVWVFRECTCA